jgi:hypothetical protein
VHRRQGLPQQGQALNVEFRGDQGNARNVAARVRPTLGDAGADWVCTHWTSYFIHDSGRRSKCRSWHKRWLATNPMPSSPIPIGRFIRHLAHPFNHRADRPASRQAEHHTRLPRVFSVEREWSASAGRSKEACHRAIRHAAARGQVEVITAEAMLQLRHYQAYCFAWLWMAIASIFRRWWT